MQRSKREYPDCAPFPAPSLRHTSPPFLPSCSATSAMSGHWVMSTFLLLSSRNSSELNSLPHPGRGEEMEALCSYLGGVLSGRRGQRSAAAGAAAAGDDVIASAPGDVDQVRGAQKRGRDTDTAAGRGAGTAACRMRACG